MKYHIDLDIDFKRNTDKGLYIAFEGIDGSGKTTQVEQLVSYCKQKGKTVVATREPRNDGLVGSMVRQILEEKIKVPSVALQYLFSADRAIHHAEIVLPALKRGEIVISDRCFWSAIPYGILDRVADTGGAYDFKTANLVLVGQSILSMYHQFTVPDITFYLEISADTAMQRLSGLGRTQEMYEKKEKLEKIVSGYNWLVKRFAEEFTVVNAEKAVEEVAEEILSKLPK